MWVEPTKELKRRRKQPGLTQFELAKQARLQYSRITFAETGRCQLTAEEIRRIEKVFEACAEKIAAGSGPFEVILNLRVADPRGFRGSGLCVSPSRSGLARIILVADRI
jgi:transcriptional regulator with XRE-family HTH domain